MRRRDPWRGWAARPLVAIVAISLIGAGPARKKRPEGPPPKVEETVSDLAYIVSAGETKLEGVGLVVGLDNTGADPPPSYYRTKLLDEMRKAGVEDANRVLADKTTAMVIVRVKIPTGISTKDRLDVELELPPASGTTSLAGGYLMPTRLREMMIAGGGPKEGQDLATAQGSVMIGTDAKPNSSKDGRVLGGARCKKDIPFSLVLKDSRKSIRTSAMLQKVVNERFHQSEGKDQKEMATAKTDQFLVLKVPRVYHNNQGRYFQVVKLLPMVDAPELRAQRTERWGKELLDPKTAGVAALRLEGLGLTATETLKAGLASPNAQVRFWAAEALAYLDDASGVDVLGDAAAHNPDFRAFALAAMASMDQSAAHLKLRKLMDEADVEVRYGAFNALRTLDERDAFLGQVRVLEDAAPPEEGDSMAMALEASSRRRRIDDPFTLFMVDCEGPPLIHIARTRRCEIVVFGRGQKIMTPIVLGTGSILLNASEGDETLQISKIVPNRVDDSDPKVVSSLDLGDVIRRTANLGASYPEVVDILLAASKQKNLPGPLVVDAVPAPSPDYDALQITGEGAKAKKDAALLKTKLNSSKRTRLFDRFLQRRKR